MNERKPTPEFELVQPAGKSVMDCPAWMAQLVQFARGAHDGLTKAQHGSGIEETPKEKPK